MRRIGEVIACADTTHSPSCSALSTTKSMVGSRSSSTKHYAVWVDVMSPSACSLCSVGQGCGGAIFQPHSNRVRLLCQSSWPVEKKQRVTVSVDEPAVAWLWLLAASYGLPLLGLIAGAVVGSLLALYVDAQGIYVQNVVASQAPAMAGSSTVVTELLTAGIAAIGFIGGLFAWRLVKLRLEARIETGLCLHTARIVAVSDESLETDG